ncbi:hypothetical protein Sme01_60260 [Sphaerisporangium melleum]|uniref:Secreted protein n=1 Tax=Sphaerisporangium melleum TaxID=321316 RepID=A0A917VNM0_9ACTN|nr:hypothetical protein [Sphaerisporangium melleum]GGK99051.1 hypothetical protein GCM10007964_46450 [Sphaerisporangium melleum]GII73550.1 hypothetical protein Sme01_60260 [Sphaerisporangium melleum]
MIRSLHIKGMLAMAVAAGTVCLGTGGTSAAARSDEATVPGAHPPVVTSRTDERPVPVPVPAPPVPAAPAAPHGQGDLLLSFEHVGRSPGLPAHTSAVIGLTDLPAIVRGIGLPLLLKGMAANRAAYGEARTAQGVLRHEDGQGRHTVGAPGVVAGVNGLPVDPEPLPAPVSAHVPGALDAEVGTEPATGTTVAGLRVR